MIKSFLLIVFLAAGVWTQDITPYYVLPVQTTQNVLTTYSFLFGTDTAIASNAQVSIAFPFEFDPTALTHATKVRYLINGTQLQNAIWTLNNRTFTIQTGSIAIGNITVVIDGVLNPKDYTTSSYFTVQTLFKNVVVTSNSVFARVPFTPAPSTHFTTQPQPLEALSTTMSIPISSRAPVGLSILPSLEHTRQTHQ
jgi:hypothetical protein